jgi:Cu/Zn superoxide dismutase
MKKMVLLCVGFVLGTTMAISAQGAPDAVAVITPANRYKVKGNITFHSEVSGVRVGVDLSGLTPGEHGIHIHDVDEKYNVVADAKGRVKTSLLMPGVSLVGDRTILGSDIMILAGKDVEKTPLNSKSYAKDQIRIGRGQIQVPNQ